MQKPYYCIKVEATCCRQNFMCEGFVTCLFLVREYNTANVKNEKKSNSVWMSLSQQHGYVTKDHSNA